MQNNLHRGQSKKYLQVVVFQQAKEMNFGEIVWLPELATNSGLVSPS